MGGIWQVLMPPVIARPEYVGSWQSFASALRTFRYTSSMKTLFTSEGLLRRPSAEELLAMTGTKMLFQPRIGVRGKLRLDSRVKPENDRGS